MNRVLVGVGKNTKNVAVVRGENFLVPGCLVNAVSSGMRYKDRLDLALIVSESEKGFSGAGLFTTNLFKAAPVEVSKRHLEKSRGSNIKAILINAGIANACTGEEGLKRAQECAFVVAETLKIPVESVLLASTGVIGPQIKLDCIKRSLPDLVSGLAPDKWDQVANAIMTTDTVPKMASVRIEIDSQEVIIGGIAKGSGMIAPNMATMLAFIVTNASLDSFLLNKALKESTSLSFNAVTVDGDTSTNDTVFLLAKTKGDEGSVPIITVDKAYEKFYLALETLSIDLAHQIVLDGEGATKFIEVEVKGAPSLEGAMKIARTVAESPLVKTAFYGEDANWGRIVAAVGRGGVNVDPLKVSLFFNGLCVFKEGRPIEDVEARADAIFKNKEVLVSIDLASGDYGWVMWTCDMSHDYVSINAKYRT